MEPPAFVASTVLAYGERTSMEVEKPAGSKLGDVIYVHAYVQVNGKKLSVSGLTATEVTPQLQVSTVFRAALWWVAHDGTANKIKVVWEGSEKVGSVAETEAWRGADATSPVDVTSTFGEFNSKTPTLPSIKTVTPNAVQVGVEVNSTGYNLAKTPAGFTLRTNYSPAAISRTRSEPGETGTTGLELEGSAQGALMSHAIKPMSESALRPVMVI